MREPTPATAGTDQPETLTPEESIECALEMLMVTAPTPRRSPEARADQQRRDRERMEQHRERLASISRDARAARRADVTRGRDRHVRTISLPRTRSREQSHAPRSTPKAAAKRSGDSGDSSDPPGSSPAALAALLLFLLWGEVS